MKKIIFLVSILLITTACTNINNMDYKSIINSTITTNKKNKMYNRFGSGYKYYLPKGMSVKNSKNYNEIINSNDNTYYLYVDIINYFYKKDIINTKTCAIDYRFDTDVDGYLCINEVNNKYLVEIVYNYAKIEVIVDKYYLNETINNSIIILSTIKYDDDIIDSAIKDNKIGGSEESLEIFGDKKNKGNFIDVIEEYDVYEEELPDYDVIN